MVGSQRDERGRALPYAEHRRDHVARASHEHPDPVFRADAPIDQDARELVGAPVQLPIGHRRGSAGDRERMRGTRRLRFEHAHERSTGMGACGRGRRRAPVIGRQRELTHRGRVVSNHEGEHRTEVLRHPCNPGIIEQGGVRQPPHRQFSPRQRHVELQVVPARVGGRRHELGLQSDQIRRGPPLVRKRQEDLADRQHTETAIGRDGLDNALEWHVLMANGVEHDRPSGLDQLVHAAVVAHVQAQRNHVCKEPNHLFQADVAAVRHRRADDDVVLTAVARQERGIRGKQHHVHRGMVRPSQCRKVGAQVVDDGHFINAGGRRSGRRARSVGGQIETLRAAVQLALPVRQPRPVIETVPRVVLPGGEVRKLQGKRGQERFCPRGERIVEGGEIVEKRPKRQGVPDDVMHGPEHDVLARAKSQDSHAQQRPALEVERVTGVRVLRLRNEISHGLPAGAAQIVDRHVDRGVRLDDLAWLGARVAEPRPQHGVALDDRRHGTSKSLDVERSNQSCCGGQVVLGGRPVEPVQEPQPLLRVGKGRAGRLRAG